MAETDLAQVAVQTYVYGYPMVYNLAETAKVFTGATTPVQDAGPNRFAAARRLLGARSRLRRATPRSSRPPLPSG